MNNNNGSNNNNRLDKIESALDRLISGLEETKAIVNSNSRAIEVMIEQRATDQLELEETKAIVNSNSRAIQAMIEQRGTDQLEHEERMRKHDQEITELRDISSRLTEVQLGMAKMLGNIDQTNPTILRRLMAIESKVDRILERDQE